MDHAAVALDRGGSVAEDNKPVVLGPSERNAWRVSDRQADLVRQMAPAMPVRLEAEPKPCIIDLARTAMVGVDVTPARAPIAPLAGLLPALRSAGVPIVWVNWGNRPDRLNLSPALLHVYNPTGAGVGLGDCVPRTGAAVLEKDSWSAGIVDELAPAPQDISVDKYRMSGFWDTPLDSILRNLRVDTLIFAGVNSDQCVYATLIDAACLGYDVVMLTDASATTSPSYCHDATVYNTRQCFGFTASTPDLLDAL